MGTAHQCFGQSSGRIVLALFAAVSAGACCSTALPPSVWPPADFELVVERLQGEADDYVVRQRFTLHADGVATYGTSATPLRDRSSGVGLPVFDRLSVYQLVPECTRALARRLARLGVVELDSVQGERGEIGDPRVVRLVYRAFGVRKVITVHGQAHGPAAEMLAVVAAHFPDGEQIDLPGVADRGVAPVLRGVPAPRLDAGGAFDAHRLLLEVRRGDPELLLDAFTLACRLGDRTTAAELLVRWTAATADERRALEVFPDGLPHLTPAMLEGMLPNG